MSWIHLLTFWSDVPSGIAGSAGSCYAHGRICGATADGDWDLVVATPLGERRGVLSLRTEGNTLRGSQLADGSAIEIFDGAVDGAALSWKLSITDPMPMTLKFHGSIDQDQLSGTVVLGDFGNSTFSGKRLIS